MKTQYVLLEYYTRYLREIKKLKESSINHYMNAMNVISKFLKERGKVQTSIYEVTDLNELEILREYVFNDPDFIVKDRTGHQMYSAGFNNYYRFADGEDFTSDARNIALMDVEVPATEQMTTSTNMWKRSTIIKRQSIESAGYLCEMNNGHETFLRESNHKPYMEGHHALPIHLQNEFSQSLDVYANIVCLCPVCHRKLHYGLKDDKKLILYQIYTDRFQRLANSGIHVSKDEFVKLATG